MANRSISEQILDILSNNAIAPKDGEQMLLQIIGSSMGLRRASLDDPVIMETLSKYHAIGTKFAPIYDEAKELLS